MAAFLALQNTHLYGRHLVRSATQKLTLSAQCGVWITCVMLYGQVLEWAKGTEGLEELRKKTADKFHGSASEAPAQRRKLSEIVDED